LDENLAVWKAAVSRGPTNDPGSCKKVGYGAYHEQQMRASSSGEVTIGGDSP